MAEENKAENASLLYELEMNIGLTCFILAGRKTERNTITCARVQ